MTKKDILEIAKPILFNTDMVKAILDDRKTKTSRLLKPQPIFKNGLWTIDGAGWSDNFSSVWVIHGHSIYNNMKYKPSDYLYVRETWSTQRSNECIGSQTGRCPYDSCETAPGPCFGKEYIYKATDRLDSSYEKWHPSIHMPKAAARIFLQVKDVCVKRLQNMTLDDFIAEGIVLRPEAFNDPENAYLQAKKLFTSLWDSTIPKKILDEYGWNANPWVWVYDFERI